MIKSLNILSPMHLAGQDRNDRQARLRGYAQRRVGERGYAMAVLLISISVMAVMMTVAMPVWKQAAQREKEEELIFRGKQYARAIELYGRKLPGALPANIDILVDQKFLRKKYKDPVTRQDFDLLAPNSPIAQQAPQTTGGAGARGGATTPPTGQAGRGATGAQPSRFGTPGGTIGLQAGIVGVVSKSKETSIRLYNGRNHYNEWVFQYIPRQQAPGVGGAPGQPGQRGGPNQPGPGGFGIGPGRGAGPGGRGDGRGGPPNNPNMPGRGGFPFPQTPQPPPQRPPGN